jgi:L-amino acid N-acyltransferase YncA
MTVTARPSRPEDAEAMAAILNRIIAIGGTTAHQAPKSPGQVRHDYIDGPDVQTSVVAEQGGQVVGWQSVGLWQGDSHIGTFVEPGLQAGGVGAKLFALTCAQARAAAITRIEAAIRADNVPGLAYYARFGFADIGQEPDFALNDGRIVGRIHRRFTL